MRQQSSRSTSVSIFFFVLLLFISPVWGFGQFTSVNPIEAGLSADRLQRLSNHIQQLIDDEKMAGVNTLILKDGKAVHFTSQGMMNIDQQKPMQKDAIFRIASMSKAVTSVAVMMLYEEGHFQLHDPLHQYIPEFENMNVAVPDSTTEEGYRTEPARNPITIRHLLTHTAGLTYGNGVASEAYAEAGLSGWYFADKNEPIGHWMKKLADLPLHAHPGEEWQYGYSTDLLGYFVEVISGMPLDRFFAERIFEPLGMTDTHFYLPPEKADRLAPVYGLNRNGDLELREPTETTDYIHGPRKAFSGGAGLMSTITDYGVFMQMLLNGGSFNGTRILSPKTVALMHANHTGDMYAWQDMSFGLGFKIIDDLGQYGELGSVGAYGWGSAYYPVYWIDPEENMAFLFLTQLMPGGGLPFRDIFKNMVYQAIVER